MATFEPGANDVLTQGLRVNPNSLARLATSPAATTLRGFDVLVHEVIAAIITAPSGISPLASCALQASKFLAMFFEAKSAVAKRRCGLEGPAKLRHTVDKSNSITRGYCASTKSSAHKPVCFA